MWVILHMLVIKPPVSKLNIRRLDRFARKVIKLFMFIEANEMHQIIKIYRLY